MKIQSGACVGTYVYIIATYICAHAKHMGSDYSYSIAVLILF